MGASRSRRRKCRLRFRRRPRPRKQRAGLKARGVRTEPRDHGRLPALHLGAGAAAPARAAGHEEAGLRGRPLERLRGQSARGREHRGRGQEGAAGGVRSHRGRAAQGGPHHVRVRGGARADGRAHLLHGQRAGDAHRERGDAASVVPPGPDPLRPHVAGRQLLVPSPAPEEEVPGLLQVPGPRHHPGLQAARGGHGVGRTMAPPAGHGPRSCSPSTKKDRASPAPSRTRPGCVCGT